MAGERSNHVASDFVSAAVAAGNGSVLAWAAALLSGCSGESGGKQQSFAAGWLLLSVLVLFMLILFGGLIRYLKAGKKQAEKTGRPLDYEYTNTEDEDEEP